MTIGPNVMDIDNCGGEIHEIVLAMKSHKIDVAPVANQSSSSCLRPLETCVEMRRIIVAKVLREHSL